MARKRQVRIRKETNDLLSHISNATGKTGFSIFANAIEKYSGNIKESVGEFVNTILIPEAVYKIFVEAQKKSKLSKNNIADKVVRMYAKEVTI